MSWVHRIKFVYASVMDERTVVANYATSRRASRQRVGPGRLALTNHDEGVLTLRAMAKPSVLPLARSV